MDAGKDRFQLLQLTYNMRHDDDPPRVPDEEFHYFLGAFFYFESLVPFSTVVPILIRSILYLDY